MAIVPVNAREVDNAGVPSTTLVFAPFGITAGMDLVVGVVLADTTKSVTGITDTGGHTYALRSHATNGTSVRTEVWESQNMTALGGCVITVTFSGSTASVATFVAYTGVAPQITGMTPQNTNTSTGSDTRPGVVLAMQEVGNWAAVVMGLAPVPVVPSPMINTAGSLIALRIWIWTSSVGIIQADTDVYGLGGDTSLLWGNVPVNTQIYAPTAWACAALELRSGGLTPIVPPIDPGSVNVDDLVSWSYTFTEGADTTPGPAQNAEVTCSFSDSGCPSGDSEVAAVENFSH